MPAATRCYPQHGPEFLRDMLNVEERGEYFHPLLGTLITGAARLMLAMAERQVVDQGLDWSFCDTDSMAIAKPPDMPDSDFFGKVRTIQDWFASLNPYDADLDLLKIEDTNYRLGNGTAKDELEPLFCFAVSSKRHVLFNVGADRYPVVRKASAHGLGHLRPPYRDATHQRTCPYPLSRWTSWRYCGGTMTTGVGSRRVCCAGTLTRATSRSPTSTRRGEPVSPPPIHACWHGSISTTRADPFANGYDRSGSC